MGWDCEILPARWRWQGTLCKAWQSGSESRRRNSVLTIAAIASRLVSSPCARVIPGTSRRKEDRARDCNSRSKGQNETKKILFWVLGLFITFTIGWGRSCWHYSRQSMGPGTAASSLHSGNRVAGATTGVGACCVHAGGPPGLGDRRSTSWAHTDLLRRAGSVMNRGTKTVASKTLGWVGSRKERESD